MNALIDTHTHLYTEEFDADRELAVIRAVEAGVTRLFVPNIDDTTVEAMLKLCEAHDCCYPMIGFHPTSVDAGWKERLEKVKGYLTSSSHCFYGIGEVGIDLSSKLIAKTPFELLQASPSGPKPTRTPVFWLAVASTTLPPFWSK